MSENTINDQERLTILLVDDTPANLELLITVLKKEGHETSVAKNGKTAIKRAAYLKPDLILLDILMPEMDGYEVCKILKSQEETKGIPIIFMSGLTDSVDKMKGFKLGGLDYITKPFEEFEVLARVNNQLYVKNLEQQVVELKRELEEATSKLKSAKSFDPQIT